MFLHPFDRPELSITIGVADVSRAELLTALDGNQRLRAAVAAANVILTPRSGFRGINQPLFPDGTAELFRFLQERSPETGLVVELPVPDEEYSEVALHADLVTIVTVIASSFVAPVVVNLISEYLKKSLIEREKRADVTFEIVIEQPDGSTHMLRYQGPATSFEKLVSEKLKQVIESETEPRRLPTQSDE